MRCYMPGGGALEQSMAARPGVSLRRCQRCSRTALSQWGVDTGWSTTGCQPEDVDDMHAWLCLALVCHQRRAGAHLPRPTRVRAQRL